ncbi:uncharacterized protein LOC129605436 [Condylostylus longicornis]|uniref:uncharacterized protein LOC129605436 n=1 Tax=Condylostylus longicornis TaxID=2530218 RepID=UPI00244E49E2|nr:uncharacterized protein LOC129605436 [Condylostylus longicornis]
MRSQLLFLVLMSLLSFGLGGKMLYKKIADDNVYEPDLVPISSTVIPLSALEVSYGLGGKPSEEYKMAYLKKLIKKVKHEDDEDLQDPDTLITAKKKYKNLKKEKTVEIKEAL